MIQMDPIDRLTRAALSSDEEFVSALNDLLRHDLRISIRELSEKSGIAQSSLYKIMHGKRSPNLSTLRAIIRALRLLYRTTEGEFIGLIVARSVLDTIEEKTAEVDAKRVRVREYPVHTMEDAIVAAVRAEREGAVAIVVAPDPVECGRAARPYPGRNNHPPRISPAGNRTRGAEGVDLINILPNTYTKIHRRMNGCERMW